MPRTDPQYKLRMPPELKEHLEESASQNKRSLNAEIVARLEDSYRFHDKPAAQVYTEQKVMEILNAAVGSYALGIEQAFKDSGVVLKIPEHPLLKLLRELREPVVAGNDDVVIHDKTDSEKAG